MAMGDHKVDPSPTRELEAKPTEAPMAFHDEDLVDEARLASAKEQQMSLLAAIKLYPKAIGWSVLLSSTLIMEGYDLALLGSLYASPVFNQKFGDLNPETGEWAVSAAWQSGLSNGARAGEIIGLILAGWAADRYGYKMTTIGSLILMIAFVFILFFAPSAPVLVVGEILCGMTPSPHSAYQTPPRFCYFVANFSI
jgi:SP family general alpha glucoside:H+ symporter-like MFS transporter